MCNDLRSKENSEISRNPLNPDKWAETDTTEILPDHYYLH